MKRAVVQQVSLILCEYNIIGEQIYNIKSQLKYLLPYKSGSQQNFYNIGSLNNKLKVIIIIIIIII